MYCVKIAGSIQLGTTDEHFSQSGSEILAQGHKRAQHFRVGLVCVLVLPTPVTAQTPKTIENPDQFSADVIQAITRGELAEAAATIAGAVGGMVSAQTVHNSIRIFEGKRFDFVRKVIDNEVGGALRQMIYYSYIENIGFIYFRFNFKMTSKGWVMAQFTLKDASQEMFPKDFVDR